MLKLLGALEGLEGSWDWVAVDVGEGVVVGYLVDVSGFLVGVCFYFHLFLVGVLLGLFSLGGLQLLHI